MISDTSDIMEYCVKVLFGHENPHYWKEILEKVDYELRLYQYNGGPKTRCIYRVKDAFIDLITKFKYVPLPSPLRSLLLNMQLSI